MSAPIDPTRAARVRKTLRHAWYLLVVGGLCSIAWDFAHAAWTMRWDGWIFCLMWLATVFFGDLTRTLLRYFRATPSSATSADQ